MRKLWVFLLLLFVTSVLVRAQAPDKKFNLISVKGIGSKAFTEAEIVAASGLHLNSQVNQQSLLDATNALIATGVFQNVVYQFTPDTANNVSVTFTVLDNSQTLPVLFQNFVWFSRDELNTKLHERLPLYRENVPMAGGIHEQIKNTLQELIAAQGVQGQVGYQLHQAQVGAPISGISYKVEGTSVRVTSLAFDGVAPDNLSALQEAGKPLLTTPYEETFVRGFCAETFHPIYLAKGYLKERCADPKVQVASKNGQETTLNLMLALQEGSQYKFGGASWTGNTVFPSSDLQKFILLKTGDIANAIKLQQDLGAMKRLYETHGYLGLTYKMQAQLQEDNTASFEIQLHEGDLYHMGHFEIRGVDPAGAGKIQQGWKLATGAVYDPTYLQEFVKGIGRFLPLQRAVVRKYENINDQNKTVDVLIEIKPAG